MQVSIQESDFGETDPFDMNKAIADGWTYLDPPKRFSFEMWDYFLSFFGKGNYRILAMTEGPDYKRGQILVSPCGMWLMAEEASKRSRTPS